MKTITCAALLFLTAASATAAERPIISGAVAYTDTARFDYTKDGVRNNVQFWVEFKGKGAAGKEGEPGFLPAEGAIYYYLFDVDKQQKVSNWLMGFSMMSEPPPSGPYPMTNLVIEGNTARFDAFRMKWEVTDGGKGFANDRVLVDDGFKPKEMKMYGGDIEVAR